LYGVVVKNDPYSREYDRALGNPASDIFLITPNDENDLQRGVKALRIYNPTSGAATLSVVTADGTTVSGLYIPAGALWTEPLRVSRVRATGTTASLIIHGYTD
jgi:hypothetical protein